MAKWEKWGAPKNRRLSTLLTEEGFNLLKKKAEDAGISLSEYLEEIARQRQPTGETQA